MKTGVKKGLWEQRTEKVISNTIDELGTVRQDHSVRLMVMMYKLLTVCYSKFVSHGPFRPIC
jgi:hypothetical protein